MRHKWRFFTVLLLVVPFLAVWASETKDISAKRHGMNKLLKDGQNWLAGFDGEDLPTLVTAGLGDEVTK